MKEKITKALFEPREVYPGVDILSGILSVGASSLFSGNLSLAIGSIGIYLVVSGILNFFRNLSED